MIHVAAMLLMIGAGMVFWYALGEEFWGLALIALFVFWLVL